MLLPIPSHLEYVDVHKHDGPFNYKTCNILLEKGKCFDRKKHVRITPIKMCACNCNERRRNSYVDIIITTATFFLLSS